MKLFFRLLLCCSLIQSAQGASLPLSVRKALQQADIPLSGVGVVVREVNARAPLLSVNASQAMNPASTMKLLTTYAALEMLGPSYTWKTEAYLNGKLEEGVLQGDLILKGYGDPQLTLEKFWLWLRDMRSRGLREIRGNLMLDRSAFEPVNYDAAAFDNAPLRPYNMGPDALLLNFNAVRLRFIPDGEKIQVIAEPNLSGITLDNRITAATLSSEPSSIEPTDCSNWEDAISIQLDGATVRLQGIFPTQCGECEQHVCLLPPAQYLYAVFRALWQEMGGSLSGELTEGTVPGSATLYATHTSRPMAEVIRDINKFSNNVMARQLFLSLGGISEEPASIARSEVAIRNWLARKKLRFPELVLENGAGLSRTERISPHHMAQLLQSAQRSPLAAEFEASLPIVGVDGTLKKRLKESAASAQAHLKTGSLKGVQAVAGYVLSRSGKRWLMVFLINHPNAGAGQLAQDKLIEWIQSRQ